MTGHSKNITLTKTQQRHIRQGDGLKKVFISVEETTGREAVCFNHVLHLVGFLLSICGQLKIIIHVIKPNKHDTSFI